jgi:hypothetical protein
VIGAHDGGAERADTLRWAAAGELRFCDCEVCWSHEPFWRYAELLANHAARAGPGASRADVARGIWAVLAAPVWRRLLWRVSLPGLRRAVAALRETALREGWNDAQLYEAVLRGIALHWQRAG